MVVERKKSSPIVFEKQEQIMTEAGLFIHPITYDDFGIQPAVELEEQQVAQHESTEEVLDVNNNLESGQNEPVSENLASISPEPDIDEIIKQAQLTYGKDDEVDEELDAEMQRKIEEMIESVMSTAREQAEWMKGSQEEKIENEMSEELFSKSEYNFEETEVPKTEGELELTEEIPIAPPRRKSNIDESILRRELSNEEQGALEISSDSPEHILEPNSELTVPQGPTKEPSFDRIEYEVETQTSFDIPPLQAQDSKDQPADDNMELSLAEDRPSSPFPSRLHLSSLEIDSLSVSQLQAGRITASEIDSHSIVTNEFESKSTNLPGQTVQIELPPGLIEEIVERVRTAERAEIQALIAEQQKIVEEQQKIVEEQRHALEEQRMHVDEPKAVTPAESAIEEQKISIQQETAQTEAKIIDKEVEPDTVKESTPPERPPLPEDYHASTVPQSFYQLRDPSGDDNKNAHHPTHHQRRKKHVSKKKDSTSDDDYQKERPRSRTGTINDQSVATLGGQFLRACGNSLIDSGSQLMEILRASSKDENNRDLHVALIILIVIVAGLFLMGTSNGKSVHHHHWDFFNPPENQGR